MTISYRSLAVGTTSGYKLYTLNSTDNVESIYENRESAVYSNTKNYQVRWMIGIVLKLKILSMD